MKELLKKFFGVEHNEDSCLMQKDEKEIISSLQSIFKKNGFQVFPLPQDLLSQRYQDKKCIVYLYNGNGKIIELKVLKEDSFIFSMVNTKTKEKIGKHFRENEKTETFSGVLKKNFVNFFENKEVEFEKGFIKKTLDDSDYKKLLEEFEKSRHS